MLVLIPFSHILGAGTPDMEVRWEGVAPLLLTSKVLALALYAGPMRPTSYNHIKNSLGPWRPS